MVMDLRGGRRPAPIISPPPGRELPRAPIEPSLRARLMVIVTLAIVAWLPLLAIVLILRLLQ